MTRAELVDELARRRAIHREVAESIVDELFRAMLETLQDGGRVEIRGFGSFKVREYGGYTGRNPKTGQEIAVAPKRLPVFKISRTLHEQLNQDI